MKILLGIILAVMPVVVSGCGSSQPRAEFPPHIQAKRDKAEREWHDGYEKALEGKSFVQKADASQQYERQHGPMPR